MEVEDLGFVVPKDLRYDLESRAEGLAWRIERIKS